MGWDGSGNFNRTDGTRTGASVWQNARDASVKIVASGHDTHDEDIATGLENCLTRDGQNSPSANLPMNSKKHTNVANGSARTEYPSIGQLQDASLILGGTTGGTATAYTISLTPAITAYTNGMEVVCRAHATSGATPTININGVGATSLCDLTGVALQGGEIQSGQIMVLRYSTDYVKWVVISPYCPGWTTWSPTLSIQNVTSGAPAISSSTIEYAKYYRVGKVIELNVRFYFSHTAAVGKHTSIGFTTPTTMSSTTGPVGNGWLQDDTAIEIAIGLPFSTTIMAIRKGDSSDIDSAGGGNRTFAIFARYEAA